MLTINAIGWKFTHMGNTTNRPHGTGDYDFIHFRDPTIVLLEGCEYTANPGACILYDCRSSHFYHSLIREKWSNDFIHFEGEDLTHLAAQLGLPFNTIFYPDNPVFLSNFIKELSEEYNLQPPFYRESIDLKLHLFLIVLTRSILGQSENPTAGVPAKTAALLQESRRQMLETYWEDWTVQKMAEAVNFSRAYFQKTYVLLFGTTPAQDLQERRMNQAKYFLGCTDLSVKEIAARIGFQEEYTFIRAFKRGTGMTPGQYALLRRNKQDTGDHWMP